MTKICKHCGHAKCYHHLTPTKLLQWDSMFHDTPPYCEFCAEQIHTDPKESGLTWEEIMSEVDDMATHEFEESI